MSNQVAREVKSAVTRSDVARHAGVSTAVVSYVVNNGPRPVAPSTATRVRNAIQELGYRPNTGARALRRGVSDAIGLILVDISNPFFAEYAVEIETVAHQGGQALILGNSLGQAELERELVDDLLGRRVDGLLMTSAHADADPLADLRPDVPVVMIDAAHPVPGRRSLGSDHAQGAAMLVQHLIDVHQRSSIALVVGHGQSPKPDRREDGWKRTLMAAGLPLGPIARNAYTREGGYAAGQELLALDQLPQAIFASSDQQAIGVLRALHEHGLEVPTDIAVVSYDGTAESEFAWPPLTVARQQVAAMAAAAIKMLTEPGPDEVHRLFAPELVIRRSCGCGQQR
ncbi:MAG: LacI family DNA-binding transcriptional regulator [Micropruina sp.]